MPYELALDQFTDEAGAIALAEAAGQHPRAYDFGEVHNDFHWHDFEAMVYVISGEITLTERETGESCTAGAGTTVRALGVRQVHREDSDGYRAVIGFLSDPADIQRPIDRHPTTLQA